MKAMKGMKSMRAGLTKAFSEKVYPNPADPKVAAKLATGTTEFKEKYLGRDFGAILSGCRLTPIPFRRTNHETRDPNDPSILVGLFAKYPSDTLVGLVALHTPIIRQAGRKFFLTTPWQKRVKLLKMISKVAQERFWLLCAAKMYETGQSVAEAIGETDEEVDFPKANAMYLEELNRDLLISTPKFSGDINGKRFVPHGVFLNICPFNFPGAIPMDMATKALAMGNAFIEKSSPKSSLCGYLVWETIKIAFERMGIEWRGVVNYAPGDADVVNAFLAHPEIAGMSFTGSSAVLDAIKKNHGDLLRYGWVARAKLVYGSAETSGVNTFIVCADADPVHAAQEYVKAFIGRSGQKCSSARIGFVHDSVYHSFVEATIERLKQVRYGDVKKGADLGAMITAFDRDKLVGQIAELEEERLLTLLYQKPITQGPGHDFPPTALLSAYGLNDDEKRKIMNTEFFGPASTIVKFGNMDEVEQMCAMTDFALTGSVFTRDVEVLRRVLNFIPAGNVYWNRKCTGALVETECFGGLRSASSPVGIKGKNALALFGSQVTFSGFYPKNATSVERRALQKLLEAEGINLSKK